MTAETKATFPIPYEPNFYKPENIIGYTGDIDRLPTVYFKHFHYYGRITQQHSMSWNVGRDRVRFDKTYHVDNYYKMGGWRAIEWTGGHEDHVSRNPIVWRQFFKPGDLNKLTFAIFQNARIKPVWEGVTATSTENHRLEQVHNARAAKTHMLRELTGIHDALFDPNMGRTGAALATPAGQIFAQQAFKEMEV